MSSVEESGLGARDRARLTSRPGLPWRGRRAPHAIKEGRAKHRSFTNRARGGASGRWPEVASVKSAMDRGRRRQGRSRHQRPLGDLAARR